MATIPAGAAIRDKATGQILGTTAEPLRITMRVDARPAIRAFTQARAAVCSMAISLGQASESMRRFIQQVGRHNARIASLRYQAKRKGRPGWRHIRIPSVRPPLPGPFAHDDHLDALPSIPLQTR